MSNSEELVNVNPQVAESEPSTFGEYQYGQDQFNVFRQVDQAEMEGQTTDEPATDVNDDTQQSVNSAEGQNGNLPQDDNPKSESTPGASDEAQGTDDHKNDDYHEAYNEGYSRADIDRIVAEARKQKEEVQIYRKFFASKLGTHALEQAERIAKQAKGQEKSNPNAEGTGDEDFRKSASEAWGIGEDDPFYSQFDKKVERMLDKKLAGQNEFIRQLQAEREQALADSMGNAYCRHLIDDYGMPEIVAKQATMKAMKQAANKCGGKFDPHICYQELRSFEMDEIVPVSRDIENKRYKAMQEELAQYKNNPAGKVDKGASGSSTSAAADRMLDQQNANYKASGTIPNGGAILDGYDEGDDIRNFVAFGNKPFLG